MKDLRETIKHELRTRRDNWIFKTFEDVSLLLVLDRLFTRRPR